ncbi:Guanine-hypoxanthine permease (plasmid) [Borrelia crocidurae DOU]|uniref:Guanine-hypoxanthine permease n=1 Tax=Borrelia crocidurae DOU TaxID=1293575 RepID=W5SJV9_9SPIR|nr:Guanine-hypoxanthine permease [Borrelia crocidurae DOU]
MSMAYIIAVNPAILSNAGMPLGALVTATCITAGLSSILMGFFANMPLSLASGMVINAFFAFSVVKGMNIPWEVALAAVFVEGIIFIVLSVSKMRESIINALPINLKYSISVGIGYFITFIGFVNIGILIKNEATLVSLGNLMNLKVFLTFIGIILICIFELKKIRGSILLSMCITTIIAWAYALLDKERALELGFLLPDGFLRYESVSPIFNKMNFDYLFNEHIWTFVWIVFILLFNDLFDTVGTLIGVATKGNMIDNTGKVRNATKVLLVDAIATTFGAVMGVSTVTTYIESSTGISEGGRTGLTAVVTGILFILSIFFSPLFIAVPSSATSAALIYVGFLMCSGIRKIDFSNTKESFPSFLILFLIPLTYSISTGIGIGIIVYVFLNIFYSCFKGERIKISLVMLILSCIFILKLVFSH